MSTRQLTTLLREVAAYIETLPDPLCAPVVAMRVKDDGETQVSLEFHDLDEGTFSDLVETFPGNWQDRTSWAYLCPEGGLVNWVSAHQKPEAPVAPTLDFGAVLRKTAVTA